MRAPHYPAPLFETIIEPFAGAAGYSVRYSHLEVILIDKSEYICGVWDYLIHATQAEISSLPLMNPGEDVRDLRIPQEARWLIGFWINQGSTMPKRTMGGRSSNRKFGTWGPEPRRRLAEQVDSIRHWSILHGDYRDAPDVKATWFIDPPYQVQGKQYKHQVDSYESLSKWCMCRKGQTLVCESEGADWLPFRKVTTVVGSTHRVTTEVLWDSHAQPTNNSERKEL